MPPRDPNPASMRRCLPTVSLLRPESSFNASTLYKLMPVFAFHSIFSAGFYFFRYILINVSYILRNGLRRPFALI